MKKHIVTAWALGAGLVAASAANAAITGSAHDFSNRGWNASGEICIVCHTPHHADTSVADSPLWNHQVTTATFTLYSSPTLDATLTQPDGVSKLCLSCHDGTVALENFGGVTTGTRYVQGRRILIGTDLSEHHPVSFIYDAALATTDGELFDPTTANSGMGGTIDGDWLFNAKLQCASCHDAHNSGDGNFLLHKSNAGSALCLTCHDK